MRRRLSHWRERLEVLLYMRRLRGDIRRQGWSSVATWDGEEVHSWEYTVGFDESLGQPEIIVGGLPPYEGRKVFGAIHAAIRDGALQLQDGIAWGPYGVDLYAFRELHPSRITPDWLAIALHRRQERGLDPHGLRAFQLVLPDEEGRMPWDAGYDLEASRQTPELWRAAAATARLRRGSAYDT